MQRKVVREVGRRGKWAKREAEKKSVTIWGEGARRATEDTAVMENGQSHLPNHSQSVAVSTRGRTRGSELRGLGSAPGQPPSRDHRVDQIRGARVPESVPGFCFFLW